MMTRSGNYVHVLLAMLAAAWTTASSAAAASGALLPLPDLQTTTMNDTAATRNLSVDYHLQSCPNLHSMVRSAVQAARNDGDVQITAGLLRLFFHDCFPQGCDASLLLDKTHPGSEQNIEPPNQGLNQRALQLIESIRDTVHRRCGPTVSCADILAVATSHAVNLAGGPFINMYLGHRDSVDPAQAWQVQSLPPPFADVTTLLNSFAAKGFVYPIDLVALSGAHTIGKARCNSFSDRTSNPIDDFAKQLAGFCTGDGNRQQNLDVITPDAFDNRYFVDLINRQGVLTSDQVLVNDGRTAWIVNVFASDQGNFFDKFAKAMQKMSRMTSPGGVTARRNCFRRDAGVNLQTASGVGSGDDEGLAASA